MSEGQRKLPFLSRTRPTWARRSVAGPAGSAGPAPTGTGQDVSTRSTGSIDSVERPSIPSTDSFPSSPQPQAPPPPSSSAFLPQRPTTSSSRAPPARSDPAPTAAGSLTDAGLVDNLVKRIVGRLPSYTTAVSGPLESDEVLRQASAALFEYSKRRLPMVLQPLLSQLDALTQPPHYRSDTDFVSVDLLRSQLFLLLTVTTCMSHYWVANDTPDRRRRLNHSNPNATTSSSSPPAFLDPPPLDEALANQILALCVFFLKQHALSDNSKPSFSSEGPSNSSIASLTQASLSAIAAITAATSDPTAARKASRAKADPFVQSLPTTRQAVVQEIFTVAGRIIYFLSASNWSVVILRVKARIIHYAASDELPDSSEMRILEWCCLDRRRLSAVIQELCNTFIHLKRPAQASMSVVLRQAIWSWIESFGNEFSALTLSGRRLEGGPEVLFDIIYTLSESSKRKTFAWPVMTMLLACCPDILGKLAVGEGSRSAGLSKKIQFFETLRKGLKGAKLADVAASCYVDLCRAATCTQSDPSDPSALRLLVADLDFDLKSKLFDPQRPFLTPEGVPDPELMTEALVSLYRLNSKGIAINPFPSLLGPNAADSSKLTAIYAALTLIREGQKLPWTPTVSPLLDTISRPLRAAFVAAVTPELDNNSSGSDNSRRGPTRLWANDEHSIRNEFARGILRIWFSDLRFLVHGLGSSKEETDTLRHVIHAIASVLDEPYHSSVRRLAVATLLAVLKSEAQEVIAVREETFQSKAVQLSYFISRHIIESKIDPAEERQALELQLYDLVRYHDVLVPRSAAGLALAAQTGWGGHWASLEIALLVSLTSSDADNRKLTFQCLHRAASIIGAMTALGFDPDSASACTILAFLTQLESRAANSDSFLPVALTREEQKAAIRAVFNSLKTPSPGLLAAWDEAMRRWKEFSGAIFSRVVDDESDNGSDAMRREQIETMKSPEEQFDEWSNLGSFLLAASGVCALATDSSLEAVVPSEHLPARFYRRVDRPRQTDRLIQELVDLLVSDSIKVRDSVKDALGLDLSEHQFPLFFKHLESIVGHFFDNEKGIPVTEEAFTVFIEQTVSVLQLMFNRLVEPLPKAAAVTLDSLLLSFTIYIQRLGFAVQAYRLKIGLCQLCAAVFARREGPQQDSILRNMLLEHLVSWASDSRPAYSDETVDRLHRELDAACLQAMVPLLNGLVVHPTDIDADGPIKTEPRLFSRYFDFFAFTLHRLAATPPPSKKGTVSKVVRSALNSQAVESRQYTIEALANLISANVDPAYQHFTEMGSSADLSARTAYLETLVKVIEKGTTFDRIVRQPEDDTYAQLIALIRQPDLTLAMALCEVCTATHYEDLTEVFLKIFDTPKSVAKFLKAVIEMEVSVTDHESTLFRGNSFATRILTAYARARGYHYLRNTLKDLLLTLCKKPHEFSMDFDPHRQTAADDAASRNLEQVTEAFLVCISQSIDQVPPAIREICSHIGEVVGDRFPESIFTAIGGFIFLRFINPAIVSPENIDLDLPTDNRDIRRGLVMITKVLQALANNVRFGAKEPGMRKLNDFMDVNIFGMTRFLQAISHYNRADEPIPTARDDTAPEDNPGLDEADRSFLHQFLHDNMDKLGMELLQGNPQTFRHWHDGNEGISPSSGPRTWERVTALIASLGAPPESASRLAVARWDAPEQAYASFMARNEVRMTTDGLVWSRIFYETSGNKSGLTTFIMLAHRIKAETADLESLVYYILLQLAKTNGPFEVLIDCTKFTSSNEVPTQWIVQLVTILPASINENMKRIFIFGPNSLLQRYLRKLNRIISFERLDSRRAIALSSITELEQYFFSLDTILPQATVTLAREKRVMFSHITERHQIRVEHPVVFKIGQTHVLVSTVKKQDLFSDVKCGLEDVVEFADIEEIRKVVLTEGEGISMRIVGQKTLRTFLTNVRRDELFAALNVARSAAPIRAPSTSRDRSSQPEDVSAILVNTILLNLCSQHASLRGHAHDLLCSLAQSYKLEGFEEFTMCRGLYVPAAHLSFLSSVSERLATAVPTHSLGVLVQFCAAVSVASPAEGAAYIHCLRPWLHNLHSLAHIPRGESDAVQTKLRRCLRQLLNVAVREPALHAVLATRVWPAVGKIDFLIPILIDEAVRCITAYDLGSEADPCPIICQILVSLSAGTVLRGRVVARLRKTLIRSTLKVVPQLPMNPDWPELAALVRIDLALSFDSRLGAQLYLPDVLHACISLVATGPAPIRAAVYGLLVNTVHSLAKDAAADAPKLKEILATLTGHEAERLFELTPPSDEPGATAWHVETSGEELVRLMSAIIDAGAPSTDAANTWRARWTGLSTANCFQYNPVLQPRAYIVIGGIGLGHENKELDADLIFQILTTLRGRIRLSSKNDGTLAAVIIQCLVKTLPGLSAESTFWQSTFWVAVSFLQIGNPRIAAAGIRLLAVVLEGLEDAGWFKERPMNEVLLDLRPVEGNQIKLTAQLDQASGVEFNQFLSFGLATLLAKSLRHEPAKADAIDLLFKLLLCSRRSDSPTASPVVNGGGRSFPEPRKVASSALGYFIVLLPTIVRAGRLDELLVVAGLDDIDDTGLAATEKYDLIATRLVVFEPEAAFLAFALLCGLARAADTDDEYLAIFSVLRYLAAGHPDVAFYLYDSLVAVLNSVVASSENYEVLDAAQALIQSQSGREAKERDSNAALAGLGFAALTWNPVATFSREELLPGSVTPTQKELASVAGHLIADTLLNPPA